MGLRFRKSVKIAKGVRLNLSKSGISTSIGPRGSSLSIGKSGAYANFGIPGTGLSYRTKISGGRSSKQSKPKATSHSSSSPKRGQSKTSSQSHSTPKSSSQKAAAKQTASQRALSDIYDYTGKRNFDFSVHVMDDGTIMFLDGAKNEISDKQLIGLLKKHPSYLAQKSSIETKAQKNASKHAKMLKKETDAFLNIHKLAPEILSQNDFETALENLQPDVYSCRQFSMPIPSKEQLEAELNQEATENIKALFPWKKKRLVREYVESSIDSTYSKQLEEWAALKSEFETSEAREKERYDAAALQECAALKERLALAIDGRGDYIEEEVAFWLESCELPVEIAANFDYSCSNGTLSIDLDLPEIEDLPRTIGTQLASGKFKEKNKTQKQLKEEYVQCVLGLTVFLAANLFNVSPAIKEIVLSGYTQRRDANGALQDDYIVSIRFDRLKMSSQPFKRQDPEATVNQFENRMNFTAARQFKKIKPL